MNLEADPMAVVGVAGIAFVITDMIKRVMGITGARWVLLVSFIVCTIISAFYYGSIDPPKRWNEVVWLALLTTAGAMGAASMRSLVPDNRPQTKDLQAPAHADTSASSNSGSEDKT